jgi:hypothetical protein
MNKERVVKENPSIKINFGVKFFGMEDEAIKFTLNI